MFVCNDLSADRPGAKTTSMNPPNSHLLRAVELAMAAEWDAAHELVQQYEDDATAAWIHAVLHKSECDLDVARYWCRRRPDGPRRRRTARWNSPPFRLTSIKIKISHRGAETQNLRHL